MEDKLSILDLINIRIRQQTVGKLPTKQSFGELMHDLKLSDEEKCAIAERVMMAGGYDALSD